MSKEYISIERLRQFVENIAVAAEATVDEVDYYLAVKDGRLYRIAALPAPYLRVAPAEVTLLAEGDEVALSVASNTSWQAQVTE